MQQIDQQLQKQFAHTTPTDAKHTHTQQAEKVNNSHCQLRL